MHLCCSVETLHEHYTLKIVLISAVIESVTNPTIEEIEGKIKLSLLFMCIPHNFSIVLHLAYTSDFNCECHYTCFVSLAGWMMLLSASAFE